MARQILLASASILALSTAVHAQNAPMAYDWSGYYFGASVGYASHMARYEDLDFDWHGSTHEYYSDGFTYGVQAGRNWQDNSLVYGIEADISGFTNDRDTIFASDDLVNNQLNWMATLRGKAGLGIGATHLYFTGGLAVADFDRSWFEAADLPDSWPDLGDTKVGAIAGIGIERMIDQNWSWRLEAQMAYFGDNTSVNLNGYPMIIDDEVTTLRFGVNYRPDGQEAGTTYAEGTPHDFSGTYVGASIGGHYAILSASDTGFDYYGSTYDHISSGVTGGLHLGQNWQDGAQVYGLEAEFALYGGDRSFTGGYGDASWESGFNWSGALKFRSGVAAGDTLMYLLGGVIWADYDLHFTYSWGSFDMGGTHVGLIAGAGIEQVLSPNMTARLEAAYTAFDGDTVFNSSGRSPYRGHGQDMTLKAGLSYYLNGDNGGSSGVLAPTVDWAGAFVGVDAIAAHHLGSVFDRSYYDHAGSYNVPSLGAGAGVHAGYNWQDDSFVYGIVGDIAVYSNDENDEGNTSLGARRKIRSALNWMGSVRGRAGIATGESFIFATGGIAFADIDSTYEFLPAPDPSSFDLSGIRTGWTAGLGVEHRVSDNGSIKFEALYTSFGEASGLNGETCQNNLITEPCEMLGYNNNVTVKVSYTVKIGG